MTVYSGQQAAALQPGREYAILYKWHLLPIVEFTMKGAGKYA